MRPQTFPLTYLQVTDRELSPGKVKRTFLWRKLTVSEKNNLTGADIVVKENPSGTKWRVP